MSKSIYPVTPKGKKLANVVMTVLIALFLYGLFRFPGSPYKECGNGKFCGKRGQVISEDDYKSFKTWGTAMFIIWPLGFLMIWGICAAEKSRDEIKR